MNACPPDTGRYCLTLACRSAQGQVAAVTALLEQHGAYIEEFSVFDDQSSERFYVRTVFRLHDTPSQGLGELRERYAAWWEPEQGAEERGAEGLLAQARAAFEAEAWAEARAALEEVLAGDPDAPEALELAVRVALAEGRLPEARVMARRLLPALLEGPTREWMASVAGA